MGLACHVSFVIISTLVLTERVSSYHSRARTAVTWALVSITFLSLSTIPKRRVVVHIEMHQIKKRLEYHLLNVFGEFPRLPHSAVNRF